MDLLAVTVLIEKNDTSFSFKHTLCIVCIMCILLCSFPVYVFADDDSSSGDISDTRVYNDYYTDVHVEPIINTLPEGDLVEVKEVRKSVTPSDSNGLKAIILSLIGDYETVVTDYTYQSSNGYYSHSIQIEQDWSWIISACIFALVIYCTIRGIVALACRI